MAFPEILPPKPSSFTTSLLDFISRRSGSSSMSNDSIYTSLYRNISAGTSPSTDLNSLYTSFTSTLRARRQTSRTISTCRFDATVSYIGANWEIFKNYRRPHYWLFLSSCPVLEDFQAGSIENYDASIIDGSIILNYRGLIRHWSFV